jgi:16S rRNA G966 N2-methylase RsmD
MNQATQEFIERNIHEDVHDLLLKTSNQKDIDLNLAIRQIEGIQKVKTKIPTFYETNGLWFPPKLALEQSSSEITANHKANQCEGSILIDLTGGFGVDTYFFSFHFEKVIYVEKQESLCELARHNFQVLNRDNILVVNDSAEDYLKKAEKVDWIYLDPSRRNHLAQKIVSINECEPNVVQLLEIMLAKSNRIMVKLSPMIDLTVLRNELQQVNEIQIVSVENECKEVIAIIEKQKADNVLVKTYNYLKNGAIEEFSFFIHEEIDLKSTPENANETKTLLDENDRYLYEPNASILKSGAFKLIGERFGLNKLHINSHLYTFETLIPNFPGRKFKIEQVLEYNKHTLKTFPETVKKANLTVRNFPLNVNALRKKLKLSEGGDSFVFATTLSSDNKVLIICSKIS